MLPALLPVCTHAKSHTTYKPVTDIFRQSLLNKEKQNTFATGILMRGSGTRVRNAPWPGLRCTVGHALDEAPSYQLLLLAK